MADWRRGAEWQTGRLADWQNGGTRNGYKPNLLDIFMVHADDDDTTSRRSSWAFLAGKIKFDQEKSYETVYKENVPEKPLQIHHDMLKH
jgi:hypothetical protein